MKLIHVFYLAAISFISSCSKDQPIDNNLGKTVSSKWHISLTLDSQSFHVYANPSNFYKGLPFSNNGNLRAIKTHNTQILATYSNSSPPLSNFVLDIQLPDTSVKNYHLDSTNKISTPFFRFILSNDSVVYDAFSSNWQKSYASKKIMPEINLEITKFDPVSKPDTNGFYSNIGTLVGKINGNIVKITNSNSYQLIPIQGSFSIPVY